MSLPRIVRMQGLLAVLLTAAPAAAQDASAVIVADTLAAHHVGQVVTVEGRIATVKVSQHRATTYLNFRFPYPDHSFSAWIPDSLAAEFPGVEALAGRTVRVTGEIWMQDGKWPAVTLRRRTDLVELPARDGDR
jgi:hypothetical protein